MDIDIGNNVVFLEFSVGGEHVGRVVIELHTHTVPKSAENFRALCTGEKGLGTFRKPLHYKNSFVHKAIPECMIQCGDITNYDGTGGESIYGPFFEDENFVLNNDDAGMVGFANTGSVNTNNSQFYITIVPCFHLNETNVVIGKVKKGLDVVKSIAESETLNDKPILKYEITDCGELDKNGDWEICEKDGTSDKYPPWPNDWDVLPNSLMRDEFKEILTNIKSSGNFHYKQGRSFTAERKYNKVFAYLNWYKEYFEKNNEEFDVSVYQDIKISVLLNLANVKLQKGLHRESISYSDQVLELDKRNPKAIFRKAQAHIGLNNHDVGMKYLKKVQQLVPYDKSVSYEMNKLRKSMDDYLEIEKKTYAKMLSLK